MALMCWSKWSVVAEHQNVCKCSTWGATRLKVWLMWPDQTPVNAQWLISSYKWYLISVMRGKYGHLLLRINMTTFSTGSRRYKRRGRYAADTAVRRPWKTPGGRWVVRRPQVTCWLHANANMHSCRPLKQTCMQQECTTKLIWMHYVYHTVVTYILSSWSEEWMPATGCKCGVLYVLYRCSELR